MKNKTKRPPLICSLATGRSLKTSVFGIALFAAFGFSTHATEPAAGTEDTIQLLSPFTINPVASWSRDSDLYKQKTAPVCLDFLDYLNHPRSNELFNPDGTLIRENERIKSVKWETLNKEQYREGFMTVIDGHHPNIQTQYLKRYTDPEWVLQRTLAHPHENWKKPNPPEHWLYRLMLDEPYTRNQADPARKAELPTWFPKDFIGWLGDAHGRRQVNDRYGEYGEQRQWIVYAGETYSVLNSTYGDGKGALPKYLRIDVYKLILDSEGHSFLFQACALHARNKE